MNNTHYLIDLETGEVVFEFTNTLDDYKQARDILRPSPDSYAFIIGHINISIRPWLQAIENLEA